MTDKTILRALAGETLPTPPVWLMRQAGRYLPEYRATREKAGGFLDLCYTPELAAEVTLQPIRRYGFDAAILFADILLVPQALGADLAFEAGEGPRLSTVQSAEDFARLRGVDGIHDTLSPIYETVRILSKELPRETTLIGFAGAPWTVATYMIAGRGTPDQGPARRLAYGDWETFLRLLDLITEATAEYLIAQIDAGAEVVKLFDSWAGALPGPMFERVVIQPAQRIIAAIRARHPDTPVIGFPRGAGVGYKSYAQAVDIQGLAIDTSVQPQIAAQELQPLTCVQGNLDPMLMVLGGDPLRREARRIKEALSGGPHIFNLGHGITPDADPAHVDQLLEAVRG
ncbi:Uroporphyrinogen III decarboxylase [Candidatus Rhodobacter oscarellae]|uniref:Uroporphyrinogen decarboxylase n=1 Tax=Candidatus Rhodobacter oscarellae TaxID=1675527 RepID=A0A0J9GYV8_9RHOB|nr:uroporphyrinogen decarboxylase [Candidatus Rhodobacter lobularis]KMW58643.1 Uroporphyrinogen III decarboxylase [Candidatus Rhodobacter lobularis]